MKISKKEIRIIDNVRDLKVVFELRNLLHHLCLGIEIEDYDRYLSANELLNDMERTIWDRIEPKDEVETNDSEE